jgi:hypothetical protein
MKGYLICTILGTLGAIANALLAVELSGIAAPLSSSGAFGRFWAYYSLASGYISFLLIAGIGFIYLKQKKALKNWALPLTLNFMVLVSYCVIAYFY